MKLLSLQSGVLTERERSIVNDLLGNDWWTNPIVNPQIGTVEPTNKTPGMTAYADGTNWNPGDGEGDYIYTQAGAWLKLADHATVKLTADGGIAVKMINKTGGASVKGHVVTPYSASAIDNAVAKVVVDVPAAIGVFLDSGVADAGTAWVVVAGRAYVYFVGNTTRGHLARTFLTADGASYVTGQAMSEAVPAPPFADAEHWCEVGHILESRTGAGLALTNLHFN